MRNTSVTGDVITFVTDESDIAAIAEGVVSAMSRYGYKIKKFGNSSVTVLNLVLGCKQWEASVRKFIIEEAIRLLNESISKSLLE